MRTFALAVSTAVALVAADISSAVLAQVPTPAASAPSQIETVGRAESHITPDRATIMIGVQSRAATAAAAAADNARRLRAVLDTVRALGVPNELVSTMNYSVSPEMQYANGQAPKVSGYSVSNTVRVDVHRLDDIGRLIDAGLAKGANEISSLDFYSSKSDSVRRATLTLAVANARADAEALARAAGGALGQVLELTTEPVDVRPVPMIAMRSMVQSAPAPTPIFAGQETISATVNARWAFIPQR